MKYALFSVPVILTAGIAFYVAGGDRLAQFLLLLFK